ncbi:MAG: hypothetical protein WHX52_07810 [Anaerolineae bacterium]
MANPIPLQPGRFYHIYNRGNNGENLFLEERNYRYFLQLYIQHVHPVVDTYAYCLLRNHFHLLVRIKDLSGLGNLTDLKPPHQYFSNFFNAYTKAINKAYGRTGALFERPFHRVEVIGAAYFRNVVAYIHRNPQHHGFVDDFREWPYSSYDVVLSDKSTRLQRDVVLEWFGGPQEFMDLQRSPVVLTGQFTLEEDV